MCLKIVAYTVYHGMITPHSNIISKPVRKIDPMSHKLYFETKKAK